MRRMYGLYLDSIFSTRMSTCSSTFCWRYLCSLVLQCSSVKDLFQCSVFCSTDSSIILPMSMPKANPKTNFWHCTFYGLDKWIMTYTHHCNMTEYFHHPKNPLCPLIISALPIPPATTDLLTIAIVLEMYFL